MHILIIQEGTQSHIMLTTPLLRMLYLQKRARIVLMVRKGNELLLSENPYVEKIIARHNDENLESVRDISFDWIIDLNSCFKTRLQKLFLKGNKLNFKRKSKQLYLSLKLGSLNEKHLTEKYLDLISPLGITADEQGVDFFIPEKDEVENHWLPESHRQGYALLCVSAKHETQTLPTNRLIELCDRINKPIVLIGNEDDIGICEEIARFFEPGTTQQEAEMEQLNKKAVIFNGSGKFNFNQHASLIRDANWVFSYDSVYMHLAAAFDKPLYTIWGSSSPLFGEYPYRAKFTVFEKNQLSCRPCSKSGFKHCPKGHFRCMNEVTFDFYLPD